MAQQILFQKFAQFFIPEDNSLDINFVTIKKV